MHCFTRSLRPGDVEEVAANMRAMDRRECEELFLCEPLEGLRDSVDNSPWKVAVIDGGKLIAMVGVGALNGDMIGVYGKPWMVAVEGIERHARAFASLTAPIIARMEMEYPHLSNVVHNENATSIRWLRRSGFTLGFPEPVGRPGVIARRFYRVRPGWLSSPLLH